jgi:hypothetical protein
MHGGHEITEEITTMTATTQDVFEALEAMGNEQQSVALSNMELSTLATALDTFTQMLSAKLRSGETGDQETQMVGRLFAEASRLNGRFERLVRDQVSAKLESFGVNGPEDLATMARQSQPDEYVGQYL